MHYFLYSLQYMQNQKCRAINQMHYFYHVIVAQIFHITIQNNVLNSVVHSQINHRQISLN